MSRYHHSKAVMLCVGAKPFWVLSPVRGAPE